MPTPAGRLQLNSRLGFPDFEPATSDADEDQLYDERLKDGWKPRTNSNIDEYLSMEEWSLQDNPSKIQSMRERLGIPEPRDRHRRPRKTRVKSTLFPEPLTIEASSLYSWLTRLRDPQVAKHS